MEAIHTDGHPVIGFGTFNENGRNMPSETCVDVRVIKERMI
jgi:acetamidase/formamidase